MSTYSYLLLRRTRLEDCERLLEEHPDDATVWTLRGRIRQETGDLEGALADFEKAIELEPALPYGYEYRGSLFEARGKRKKALDDFTRALELDPSRRELEARIERLGSKPSSP
jgi:tetratricopeptide (TPR) repeat protein